MEGLESLVSALKADVKELIRERDRAIESRTAWGQLKNLLGYCLSVYCLIR